MSEIWKQSELEDYEVSNLGRIRKKSTHKILKCEREEKGYLRFSKTICGKKKHFAIHRLVALAFIPNPENKPQIDHIDCNKSNNCVSNLRWCSNKENAHWRAEHSKALKENLCRS